MEDERTVYTIEDAVRAFEAFVTEGTSFNAEDAEAMNDLFTEHGIDITVGVF